MAAPVWVLSVDLQTKTATFQSGMAEAAKSARGAFNDIKASAKEGTEGIARGAINAQQALGVLTNSLRGDVENALADIVREMSHTGVVMAALPFAAAAGAAMLLVNVAVEVAAKIKEWREEQERLTAAQLKFGTTVNETFNGLEEKIIAAEQKADELRNDHIGALGKQLELINRQSFAELIQSLDTVAKAADVVFAELKGHWYTFGIGADGAKHALDQFQTQYDALLAQGKNKEASDLLRGTRESAEKVLEAQKAIASGSTRTSDGAGGQIVDYTAQYRALATMKAAGVSDTKKEIEAQEALIKTLDSQLGIEQRVATLKGLESGNAKRTTGGEMSQQASEAAKNAAASQTRLGEMAIAADRVTAQARLDIAHASIQERLEVETEFANREADVQLAGNQAQIAALDKFSKDYQNQLKELQDKAVEIQQQRDTKIAQLSAQAQTQQATLDVRNMLEAEREKIAATESASAERLAAIDAALEEEHEHNLQNEDSYRGLLQQRVETVRDIANREAQERAEAGKLAADNDMRMAQIALAAQMERQSLVDSARRMTDQRLVEEQLVVANELYKIQNDAFEQRIAALDKSGKDYENKLRQLLDGHKQLTAQHENDVTAIQDKAMMARNQTILGAYTQFEQSIARGTASVLLGQQSFASMMNSLGSQVASGLIQNALMSMMTLDMTRPHEAAAAARAMFVSGMKLPFPANIVAAPALAAGAFAAVMAYNDGTDMVPGMGRGDIVPAMLEPGEGVVPGGVMDGLRNVARNGGFDGGSATNIHLNYSPTVHAVDSRGVEKMLKNHGNEFKKKFHDEVRRMNK